MIQCMRRLAMLLSIWAVTSAAAQQIVPIEQEPQHELKFRNQFVRLFDVQLPRGYRTQWHSHIYDGVFVNIEPSQTRAQDLGGDPVDRPPRIVGDTYFIDYGRKPKVHRVENLGTSTYRVADTEILRNCGGFGPVKDGEGQTLILENDRVRVTRVTIGPGEKLSLHPPCGMLVAVTAAKLRFRTPGAEELVTLNPAGFKWRDNAAPIEFTNVGEDVFQGVDIVVK